MSRDFSIVCPKCGTRLRFAADSQASQQLKLRCSVCMSIFSARIADDLPSPTDSAASGISVPDPEGADAQAPEHPSVAPTPTPSQPASTPTGASRSPGALFSPGDLLAGRFKVIRFIAGGGMGEVYEAEDQELTERVALKTVRPEISGDRVSWERFRREIQLSRKVTHPNVCRIFDLFHHQGEAGQIVFLSMELLNGETLAERLKRQGTLSADEALPIARQMAAGLGAAHRAGVIHRDFKSANVMLVPVNGGLRVVVTDFGLARGAAGSGELAQTLTIGGAMGTPAYIAPEQVEGGPMTPAVDIYALGVLLFEMRTGTVPFQGETALSTAVKRLQETAPSPRAHLPDIDPRWEATILRCLERKPEDRFATAEDVVRALTGETALPPRRQAATPSQRPPAPPPARASKSATNPLAVAGLLGIILLSGVVGYLRYTELKARRTELGDLVPVNPAEVVPRRSLAVLDFRNQNGLPERAWLSTALAEMLSTELTSLHELRVVARKNVARMQIELALEQEDNLGQQTLQSIRQTLGADLVLLGSFESPRETNDLRVSLILQDAANGDVIASWPEEGSLEDLFSLLDQTGTTLRQHLGLEAAVAGAAGQSGSVPSSTQAARLYSEGLSRLRQFDAQGARDFLEQAVRADPTNAMAHSALSSAFAALGYKKRAEESAREALARSARLPDQERLWVEARYREMTAEWKRAMEIYRSLWQSYPDDLEYGLRLAMSQASAGQGETSLATTAALRQLPPPASDDPRIDLAAAAAAGSMSNFPRQQEAAAAAATKAAAQGANLLVAEARVVEGDALRNIGRSDEAIAACEEGRKLYALAGDTAGVAFALTTMANALFDRGDFEGAVERFEEARTTYRRIGDLSNEARTLNNMAVVVQSRGDLARAQEMYKAALDLCLQVENLICEASTLNNLGGIDFRRGRLTEAKGRFQGAAEVYQTLGDKGGEAYALDNYAVVLRQQGDLARAYSEHQKTLGMRREIRHRAGEVSSLINLGRVQLYRGDLIDARVHYEQALSQSRQIGNKSLVAKALFGLADVQFAEGKLGEAEATHEEALKVRTQLGEQAAGAESRLAVARLLVERGEAVRSADLAQQAVAEFRKDQMVDNEALGHSILARALAAQGDTRKALLEMERSEVLVQMTESRPTWLEVAVATADLLSEAGQLDSATAALQASLAGLQGDDFFPLLIEAELALGRIEMRSGRRREGRIRLLAAAARARERGFELLADKAAAAAG